MFYSLQYMTASSKTIKKKLNVKKLISYSLKSKKGVEISHKNEESKVMLKWIILIGTAI